MKELLPRSRNDVREIFRVTFLCSETSHHDDLLHLHLCIDLCISVISTGLRDSLACTGMAQRVVSIDPHCCYKSIYRESYKTQRFLMKSRCRSLEASCCIFNSVAFGSELCNQGSSTLLAFGSSSFSSVFRGNQWSEPNHPGRSFQQSIVMCW